MRPIVQISLDLTSIDEALDTLTAAQIIVAVFVIGGIGFFLDRIMLVFQRLVTFEEQTI